MRRLHGCNTELKLNSIFPIIHCEDPFFSLLDLVCEFWINEKERQLKLWQKRGDKILTLLCCLGVYLRDFICSSSCVPMLTCIWWAKMTVRDDSLNKFIFSPYLEKSSLTNLFSFLFFSLKSLKQHKALLFSSLVNA